MKHPKEKEKKNVFGSAAIKLGIRWVRNGGREEEEEDVVESRIGEAIADEEAEANG